jgi:hypothetical protein
MNLSLLHASITNIQYLSFDTNCTPNLVSETKVQSPLDYSLKSFLGFRFKTVIDEQLKLGRLTSVSYAAFQLLVGNHPHIFSLIFSSHLVHFE